MRIAVVAFSPLASDSRVLRTASTLQEAGHEVLLVGRGPAPESPPCAVALLPDPPSPLAIRAGLVLRQAPATLLPATARPLYWFDAARRRARALIRAFRPDAIHANDWNTLPLALDAKRGWGARVVYDAHEMAVAEYEHSLKWRVAALAHVRAIEGGGIRRADAVVTVSAGIAEELARIYPGIPAPVVVRNVPGYAAMPFRPTGETVEVLFHGLICPNRGLEPMIASVPSWREGLHLRLRGYGNAAYLDALRAQADAAGVATRVSFEPAVAPQAVVEAAATADLGAVILPDTTRHNRFALPNKLFEYLAAGLGVVVSRLPDMAAIVDEHGCGVFAAPEPGSIAAALNALDRPAIDALKRRALIAAEALSWRRERERLIGVYERLAS